MHAACCSSSTTGQQAAEVRLRPTNTVQATADAAGLIRAIIRHPKRQVTGLLVTCMLTRSNEHVLTELDRVQQRGSGLIARTIVEDYFDSLTFSSRCTNAESKALDVFAEPGVARARTCHLVLRTMLLTIQSSLHIPVHIPGTVTVLRQCGEWVASWLRTTVDIGV